MSSLPSWLRWYKKPEYRDIKLYSTEIRDGKRSLSPEGRVKHAIPKRLKLENILQNKTCERRGPHESTFTTRTSNSTYGQITGASMSATMNSDSHRYKNYTKAYEKACRAESESQKPGPSCIAADSMLPDINREDDEANEDVDLDTEITGETLDRISALLTPAPMCDTNKNCNSVSHTEKDHHKMIDGGSRTRAEMEVVIRTFLLPDSPKELNIPPAMRDHALIGLQTSCNPIHLLPVAQHTFQLLRNCSHRNFVRLGVCNGTMETICMATGLGIVLTAAGFLCALLRAFTPAIGAHSRWNAFAPWPMWWLGMSLVLSGTRGSCFFLLLFSRRQPLPWERFDDSASLLTQRAGLIKMVSRLMIIDRKVRVKDVHLRRLQNKIVLQSLVGGFVFATAGVLLFIFLPVWSDSQT